MATKTKAFLSDLCGLERSRANGRVGVRNISSAFISVTSALIGGENVLSFNPDFTHKPVA
jgi:2-polyprenyl-3-methyl-5-hydroxy-6-metoxy-1,4-benzoquinol methylase